LESINNSLYSSFKLAESDLVFSSGLGDVIKKPLSLNEVFFSKGARLSGPCYDFLFNSPFFYSIFDSNVLQLKDVQTTIVEKVYFNSIISPFFTSLDHLKVLELNFLNFKLSREVESISEIMLDSSLLVDSFFGKEFDLHFPKMVRGAKFELSYFLLNDLFLNSLNSFSNKIALNEFLDSNFIGNSLKYGHNKYLRTFLDQEYVFLDQRLDMGYSRGITYFWVESN
jgi:hypothetical protein